MICRKPEIAVDMECLIEYVSNECGVTERHEVMWLSLVSEVKAALLASKDREKDSTDGPTVCGVCGGRLLNGRSEIYSMSRSLLEDECSHRLGGHQKQKSWSVDRRVLEFSTEMRFWSNSMKLRDRGKPE